MTPVNSKYLFTSKKLLLITLQLVSSPIRSMLIVELHETNTVYVVIFEGRNFCGFRC